MRTNRTDSMIASLLDDLFVECREIRAEMWRLRRDLFTDKEQIMSALDDLKAAMSSLITEATTDIETLLTKIGTTPHDDTEALQALAQQANDAVAKFKADMAPLTAPPAAPPAPVADPGPTAAPAADPA